MHFYRGVCLAFMLLYLLVSAAAACGQVCDSSYGVRLIAGTTTPVEVSVLLPWQDGAVMLGATYQNTATEQLRLPLLMTATSGGIIKTAVSYGKNEKIDLLTLLTLHDGNLLMGGNYAIKDGGNTKENGLLLVKAAPDGSIIWSWVLRNNQAVNNSFETDNMIETTDGDIILSMERLNGSSYPVSNFYNLLLRIAPDGMIRWSKKLYSSFYKPSNQTVGNANANGLLQLPNGNIVLAALLDNNFGGLSTSAAYYFAELDYGSGSPLWEKAYTIPKDLSSAAAIAEISLNPDKQGVSLIGYLGNTPLSVSIDDKGALHHAVVYYIKGKEADELYLNGATAVDDTGVKALSITDFKAAHSALFSIDKNGHLYGVKGVNTAEGSNGHKVLATNHTGDFYLVQTHYASLSEPIGQELRYFKTNNTLSAACFEDEITIEESDVQDQFVAGSVGMQYAGEALGTFASFPIDISTFPVETRLECNYKNCPEGPVAMPPDVITLPIAMPSAFTPNSDGLNDVFRVKLLNGNKLLRLSVYNRFGQLLFAATDTATGWNGMVKGMMQTQGVYIYQVEAQSPSGKRIGQKGTVVLLR